MWQKANKWRKESENFWSRTAFFIWPFFGAYIWAEKKREWRRRNTKLTQKKAIAFRTFFWWWERRLLGVNGEKIKSKEENKIIYWKKKLFASTFFFQCSSSSSFAVFILTLHWLLLNDEILKKKTRAFFYSADLFAFASSIRHTTRIGLRSRETREYVETREEQKSSLLIGMNTMYDGNPSTGREGRRAKFRNPFESAGSGEVLGIKAKKKGKFCSE